MNDPQDKIPAYPGEGSGYRSAQNPVKTGLARPTAQSNQPAQNGRPLGQGSQAPTTRRLSPQELAEARKMEGYFDRARNRGQISMMKDIGQNLKNDYGYEYGIGDGGWPYIKPPSSDVIFDEAGLAVRKEAVARQIAMDRAEREERDAAAHDTRGPIRRGAEGFLGALKAKFGDIEAGIGRGIQTVEETADYYRPEAVAARYLKKRAEGSAPAISPREPYFGEQLKGRGQDIAASARHHQDVYGQDLASQAGWVLGDSAANVGAGMLGGPYGVGILDAAAAYGRGEPLQQALGTGAISTASMEAGGGLGGMLEEKAAASPLTQYFGRAGKPVARYLGRSTGYAAGPQAVSIPGTAVVYGKPQIPNSAKEAALDIAQGLGLGFLPGRGAAVKRIAIDPGTAPDVRAALHAILNGEIPPRAAPESLTNVRLRPGVSSENAGGVQGGVSQSEPYRAPSGVQAAKEYMGPHYQEFERLRRADPARYPDPEKTTFRVVKGPELTSLRDAYKSSGLRGHHTHPLAHGGPAIPESGGLAYTGETQIRKEIAPDLDWSWYPNKRGEKTVWHAPDPKSRIVIPGPNPRHAAATKYWRKLERWQRKSGMR